MGLDPSQIPTNFDNDLDHWMQKKNQRSGFSHLLIITCLSTGLQSVSVFVVFFTGTCDIKYIQQLTRKIHSPLPSHLTLKVKLHLIFNVLLLLNKPFTFQTKIFNNSFLL